MSSQNIYRQALKLSKADRAGLVEQLLISLDEPDNEIEAQLAVEVERRINAYEKGEIYSISAEEVFVSLAKN